MAKAAYVPTGMTPEETAVFMELLAEAHQIIFGTPMEDPEGDNAEREESQQLPRRDHEMDTVPSSHGEVYSNLASLASREYPMICLN